MNKIIVAIIILYLFVLVGSILLYKKKKKILALLIPNIVYVLIVFISYSFYIRNTVPILKIKGEKTVIVEVFDKYIDEGYMIIHPNKKLDSKVKVTNKVNTSKIGIYNIIYSLNYRGKIIKEKRKVKVVDNTTPIIELKGDKVIELGQSKDYIEPGYSATDNYDGDITDKVKVTNNIGSDIGSYEIIYTVEDSSKNSFTIKRTVNKFKDNNGIIYLTFDDGPSSNTKDILDILKSNDIKATFFVVNYSSLYDDMIKRIVNEGHTIALHSYTHQYKLIYSSSDAYFDDLYKLQNRVYDTTGIKSNIIRFPGGSSNTVSSFNKGIMTKLVNEVKEKGFKYFDWNVDSRDAGGAKTKEDVYKNVMSGLVSNRNNVVLMHDLGGNKKTVDALDDIIKSSKSKGYTFSKINEDTPMVIHRVNN